MTITPLRAALVAFGLGCALLAAAIGWQLRAEALSPLAAVQTR